MSSVDEYGVPLVIFGVHHQDFFPLLGRIVAVSAVIERDVRTLAARLAVDRAVLKSPSIKSVIGSVRRGLKDVDDAEDRKLLATYVSGAAFVFERRNRYVHSLWPSVSLGRSDGVVGWTEEPWMGELELDVDLTELREDLKRFAELVVRWNNEVIHIFNRLAACPVAEES